MSPIPTTMTQLLKDPHSIQSEIDKGQVLIVFSRSRPIFEIHPLSSKQIKKKDSELKLPTISVPMADSLSRNEIYSDNSWLDKDLEIVNND